MSPEQFRKYGYQVVDWLARYMENVESLPVLSQVQPGDIRKQLPARAPEQGEPFSALLRDVEKILVPGLTHWQSPNFFAFFPANNSGPSILGELLSAGLGVQGMLWITSPACTELETHVLDWLADLLGLPDKFRSTSPGGGVIQDSASSATLCALLAARERASGGTAAHLGSNQRYTAYASSQAHSSVEKAAMIAGLGADQLRKIDVDANFALRPDLLEQAIQADLAQGFTPCYVCATIGTTSSGALDPLPEIGALCRKYGLWLHVDGAMYGMAGLCPEYRDRYRGLDLADSYCVNAHKWLLTNMDCDCFFVADRAALTRALQVLPEYLRNRATETSTVIDYRDWQIPLGRRFRALKLWFVLRYFGAQRLRRLLRLHLALAQEFAKQVQAHSDWELACPVGFSLVCFRHKAGNEKNTRILALLNQSGECYLTHTKLAGKITLRLAVGQARTRRRHVRQAWHLLQRCATEC